MDCMEKETWTPDSKSYKRSKQKMVSTVAPLCVFLRIENKAKTKRDILSRKMDFREENLKTMFKNMG